MEFRFRLAAKRHQTGVECIQGSFIQIEEDKKSEVVLRKQAQKAPVTYADWVWETSRMWQ